MTEALLYLWRAYDVLLIPFILLVLAGCLHDWLYPSPYDNRLRAPRRKRR